MVKPKKIRQKAKYKSRKNTILNCSKLESSGSTKGLDLLYGRHAVLSALANSRRQISRILLTFDTYDHMLGEIKKALISGGHAQIKIQALEKKKLDSHLPYGAVHQGIALEAKALKCNLEDIINQTLNNEDVTIIILDQATDTHNIGSILRSAAAFNATAVVIQDRKSPMTNGTIAKAASGAMEHVALVRTTNLVRAMDKLKAANYWCVGLDGKEKKIISQSKLPGRVVFVLGSEDTGLRRLTRQNCDLLVKVPTSNKVESLNLSNAAAIALYEKSRSENSES